VCMRECVCVYVSVCARTQVLHKRSFPPIPGLFPSHTRALFLLYQGSFPPILGLFPSYTRALLILYQGSFPPILGLCGRSRDPFL